jgi:hypothetical protein
LDENLQEETKNANEAITEQPTRLYTVTDLNKLLHIQGVRLYTDIWTPLKIHVQPYHIHQILNKYINFTNSVE